MPPSATVICADSNKWLDKQKSIPNVITGICDMDEINMTSVEKYKKFFTTISKKIMKKLQPGCYAIFIQTDRKVNKSWLDKSYLLSKVAEECKLKTIWHKIVLHRDVNKTDLFRPTYAHMMCFSKDGTTGAATPDVLPVSKRLYKNGTPVLAAQTSIDFVKRYSKNNTIIDPFAGMGTVPKLAVEKGLNVVAIDIDPKQCALTKKALGITSKK